MNKPLRVVATEAAVQLIEKLQLQHQGKIFFHQSGGCCEGSSANCLLEGELTIGTGDIFLGTIGNCPFYMSKAQYESWKHTQIIIDVTPGVGNSFSLEATEGVSFLTRSRLFTPEELLLLESEK